MPLPHLQLPPGLRRSDSERLRVLDINVTRTTESGSQRFSEWRNSETLAKCSRYVLKKASLGFALRDRRQKPHCFLTLFLFLRLSFFPFFCFFFQRLAVVRSSPMARFHSSPSPAFLAVLRLSPTCFFPPSCFLIPLQPLPRSPFPLIHHFTAALPLPGRTVDGGVGGRWIETPFVSGFVGF